MSGAPTWTAEEDALLKRLWQQGLSALAIAVLLHRSAGAVEARVARLRMRRA